MARLILFNGAPGSGKSTLASRWADARPMTLALDVDVLKHMLGAWDADQQASGLQARVLALAVIRQHLEDGYDVIVAQYLARHEFADSLLAAAAGVGATYTEVVLDVDTGTLATRLAGRAAEPGRPEHVVNSAFVSPADAPVLANAVATWAAARPGVVHVTADGSLEDALAALTSALP